MCRVGPIFFVLLAFLIGASASAGNIAFLVSEDNAWTLYHWNFTSPPEKIPTSPLIRDWAVSPDGKRLAYSCTTGEMFLKNLNDGTEKRISGEKDDWQNPAFLSNDSLIIMKNIFTQDRDESDLLLYDLAKEKLYQTLEQSGSEEYPTPSPTAPGVFAYLSTIKIFQNRILSSYWLADLEHKVNRPLTAQDETESGRPQFMPDGKSMTWLQRESQGMRFHLSSIESPRHKTEIPLCKDSCEPLILSDKEILVAEPCAAGTCLTVKDFQGKEIRKVKPFEKGGTFREMGLW